MDASKRRETSVYIKNCSPKLPPHPPRGGGRYQWELTVLNSRAHDIQQSKSCWFFLVRWRQRADYLEVAFSSVESCCITLLNVQPSRSWLKLRLLDKRRLKGLSLLPANFCLVMHRQISCRLPFPAAVLQNPDLWASDQYLHKLFIGERNTMNGWMQPRFCLKCCKMWFACQGIPIELVTYPLQAFAVAALFST